MPADATDLPIIDEHSRLIDAGAPAVWAALGRMLTGMGKPTTSLVVRLVGARPARASGDPLQTGSALRGFGVARAEPPKELVLEGHHRYSRYMLTFRLEPASDATWVRAETRAVFPGILGRLYKAAVIDSRGHVLAVRRMLAGIAHEAAGPRTAA